MGIYQNLMFVLSSYLLSTQVAEGSFDLSLHDFECVDIYKQPAFQHPLLKNHKIQEKFISGENIYKNNEHKTNDQSCPKGTVSILKQRNVTESVYPNTIKHPHQHFAVMQTIADGSIYRGAQADISLHSVDVQNNQYTKSQIWIESGPRGQVNSIQAGWSVNPNLYGDRATRFTIYWTADNYRTTGCYNTICPGFVIITQNPSIGAMFESSIYGGEKTLYFTPEIIQDSFTGAWALKVFDEVIGYWPRELFTTLNNGASLVRFGGKTLASPDGISPPMGNGHFPVIDFQKSSSFLHLKVMNSKYELIDIENKRIRSYVDSKCFILRYWGYNNENGIGFSYGGPGGNCGI